MWQGCQANVEAAMTLKVESRHAASCVLAAGVLARNGIPENLPYQTEYDSLDCNLPSINDHINRRLSVVKERFNGAL